MGFGQTKTTGSSTQNYTPPAWLTSAAAGNVNYAQGLEQAGFQPYQGNQVASFSPMQRGSFGTAGDIANTVNPTLPLAGFGLSNYTTAGAGSVRAPTIASRMSPYMSQYVQQALQPQLFNQDQQFNNQTKGFDSSATGAGAFGDTGWGLGRSTLAANQAMERAGLVGNAYNNAFNTAIGAGAQDVSNNINAQTTNANLRETALNRNLTGANAILGANTGAANLTNTFGGQVTAQDQAKLNAAYNQWALAQQYPFQAINAMNSTIGASSAAVPKTTTTTNSAPDNSGYGMIGSVLGGIGGSFFGPGGTALGASLGGAAGSGLGSWFGGSAVANPNDRANGVYPEAKGGPTPPVGSKVLVGERGPELYMPHDGGAPEAIGTSGPELRTAAKPGTVIPHHALEALRKKYAKKSAKTSSPGVARAAMGGTIGPASAMPMGGGMPPAPPMPAPMAMRPAPAMPAKVPLPPASLFGAPGPAMPMRIPGIAA